MDQIQVGYNAVQDRLVLSVNDKDKNYKVWLTRRFVMLFLAQLQQTTENDPVVQQQHNTPRRTEIMEFQKQHAASQGKVSKSAKPIEIKEQDEEPLLATGIRVDGQTLHVQCLHNKRLSFGLTTGLSYGLINLIEKTLTHTGWGFKGVKPKSDEQGDVTARASWSVSLN